MATTRVADATAAGPARDGFHALVDAVYAGEPPGTAPAAAAVERNLARASFAGRQRLFLAEDAGGQPRARAAARLSPVLRDDDGVPIGLIGFFESHDDAGAAGAVLRAAAGWLRAEGARRVIGPMDGDTWHRYRVNAGPFARAPFPLEPWNPPYYAALWRAAGFRDVESYSSKWIGDVGALLPGLEAAAARSASHGVRMRPLDVARARDELAVVHRLSSAIFADAFLYTPIGLDEFLGLYAGVERLLDPELVFFATAPDGAEIGFVFAYADPRLPAVHYKTIAVERAWRRAGVAAALAAHAYTNALRQRRPQGNHALMRDDNRSQALDQGLGAVFRRYVLFEQAGDAA